MTALASNFAIHFLQNGMSHTIICTVASFCNSSPIASLTGCLMHFFKKLQFVLSSSKKGNLQNRSVIWVSSVGPTVMSYNAAVPFRTLMQVFKYC